MTKSIQPITVTTIIHAPIEKVWSAWTTPADIMQWNSASEDWHTPHAENDLRVGGQFSSRMESKDGQYGFDFGGVYDVVDTHKRIAYTLGDERRVQVDFESDGDNTIVTETFDAESENTIELQRSGWQAILDNFKKHVENKS